MNELDVLLENPDWVLHQLYEDLRYQRISQPEFARLFNLRRAELLRTLYGRLLSDTRKRKYTDRGSLNAQIMEAADVPYRAVRYGLRVRWYMEVI